MKIIAALVCPLAFASCGNLKYMVDTYGKTKPVAHNSPEMSIRVFDRPDISRMMVTPALGRAFGMGAASGATLGIWSPGMDPFPYQNAAQHYLDSSKRGVRITSGKLLMKPQWEFTYQ